MASKNDDLLKKLLATFRVEADEHLKAMTSGLLSLEKLPSGAEAAGIIETIFREAHSLKGASRAINRAPIESMCQSLENVFAALKGSHLPLSLPLFDLLHQAIDALGDLLAADPGTFPALPPTVAALMRRLDRAASGSLLPLDTTPPAASRTPAASTATHAASAVPVTPSGTVRVSTVKLDAVMRQVEALLSL